MFATALRKASAKNFLTSTALRSMSSRQIPVVESVEDHKAPATDDSVEGRYASVLFTCASQENLLYKVFEDMHLINELYKQTESFRVISQNSGLTMEEVRKLNDALNEVGDMQPLTSRFIEVLCENKRLVSINAIAEKYQKLYQELNKEEKITIISADELDSSQRDDVLDALKANPENEGKHFILEFQVDKSIKGGLILYTESEYMDMSLSSRINRIRQEVNSLAN